MEKREIGPFPLSQLMDFISNNISDFFGKFRAVFNADITDIYKSNTGHYYLTVSDKGTEKDYTLTVTLWKSMISMIKKSLDIEDIYEMKGKKYTFTGTFDIFRYNLSISFKPDNIILFGESEREKQRKEITEKLKKEKLINTLTHQLSELEPIKKIAVITSEKAAGFGDFITHLNRAKFIPVYEIFPSSMQGINTVKEIQKSFDKIKKSGKNFDLTVILRGGGSIEDLYVFDNYELCRETALFMKETKIPVLTAIGHEKDKNIIGMVSWKDYPTPTSISDDISSQINRFYDLLLYRKNSLSLKYSSLRQKTFYISRSRIFSGNYFSDRKKNLSERLLKYSDSIKSKSDFIAYRNLNSIKILSEKTTMTADLKKEKNEINTSQKNINSSYRIKIMKLRENISAIRDNINKNNDISILENGGSILTDSSGKKITSVKDIKEKSAIKNILKDGNIISVIKETESHE
ncbi:MAG: hypothetical protein H7A30_08230 [Thermotogae bacterium]|nr:hypothetical protein [Thermotogota bacterium]